MKKIMIIAALIATGVSSLMAWDGVLGTNNVGNQGPKAEISVLHTKIKNSELDSGTVVSLRIVKPGKSWFVDGLDSETGTEIAYGKMDYSSGNGDASYSRFGAFREIGRSFYNVDNVNVYGYAGIKTQIMLVNGLKNKGIGFGPYVKLGVQKDRFGVGAEFSIARDYFEGGNWFTETNAGGYISYSF